MNAELMNAELCNSWEW